MAQRPMCGRFDTSHMTWAQIHDALASLIPVRTAPLNLEPTDDARPTDPHLTARIEDGAFVLEKMRWGLVPYWRAGKPLKDTAKGRGDGFKAATFNCRIEGCATAASFKEAFARRRCIVPASAWYEWTGPAGAKVKHRFARADGEPIWFAGLWDRCPTSDAGEVTSFTILTGPSDGWLSGYHDRAPVVLEKDEWLDWLDPRRDATALLRDVRADRFAVRAAA